MQKVKEFAVNNERKKSENVGKICLYSEHPLFFRSLCLFFHFHALISLRMLLAPRFRPCASWTLQEFSYLTLSLQWHLHQPFTALKHNDHIRNIPLYFNKMVVLLQKANVLCHNYTPSVILSQKNKEMS